MPENQKGGLLSPPIKRSIKKSIKKSNCFYPNKWFLKTFLFIAMLRIILLFPLLIHRSLTLNYKL